MLIMKYWTLNTQYFSPNRYTHRVMAANLITPDFLFSGYETTDFYS